MGGLRGEYAKRKAAGLCPSCGKEGTGGKRCQECIVSSREAQIARRAVAAEKGLCVRCGRPTKATLHCQICLAYSNIYNSMRHYANREKGLCSCGSPPRLGGKTCAKCHVLKARKVSGT
jgi:hypothetical protein